MSKHVPENRAPRSAPHADKYAGLAATGRPGPRPVPTEEQEREAALRSRALTADAENEAILRSLPGGTPNERVESARRGLHLNQDAIQTARKDDH